MSRLTATQVIEKGDYLKENFNPATLTVSQLLGIFGYHEIRYPTPYSKPKLIQIFNNTIKVNAQGLSDSRSEAEPSDDGITDGITGEPISNQRAASSHDAQERTPRKRSKNAEEVPVKRRRSTRRSSSRKMPEKQPVVIGDSDSEADTPQRIPNKGKKKAKAPAKKRVSEAEDSGWEDNNVFQSGPDSSPTRPPKKTRRSSVRIGTSRKSASLAPSTPAPVGRASFSPEGTPIRPSEPSLASKGGPSREPTPVKFDIQDEYYTTLNDAEDVDEEMEVVSETGSPSPDLLDKEVKGASSLSTVFLGLLILAFLHLMVVHKTELAEIGYCDTGKDTNDFLQMLKARQFEEEICRTQNTSSTPSESMLPSTCPPPDILPFIHPTSCIQCPSHGSCTQHSVTCEKGFLLQTFTPFPVYTHTSFEYTPVTQGGDYVSRLQNAFTSLWPYIRPQCTPDTRREQKILALRRTILTILAHERGTRLCAGDFARHPTVPDSEGGEAKRWGIEFEVLKQKVAHFGGPNPPNFDDMFEEAFREVSSLNDVFMGGNSNDTVYIAHKTPSLPWSCAITVKARQAWADWQITIFGICFFVIGLVVLRYRRAQLQVEKRHVAELVQEALEVLQTQERAHHTDSVSNPVPYYSSDQLRDYILQDEHSVPRRQRLWDQVSRIVEANANIRVNQEEITDGDEVRVWRWVGRARGPRKSLQSGEEAIR